MMAKGAVQTPTRRPGISRRTAISTTALRPQFDYVCQTSIVQMQTLQTERLQPEEETDSCGFRPVSFDTRRLPSIVTSTISGDGYPSGQSAAKVKTAKTLPASYQPSG